MMGVARKVMIVAPFWGQAQHVGVYRVDRFVRWLSAAGLEVILVRAGRTDQVRYVAWGVEITVRDPLGLYDGQTEKSSPASARRPSRLRRLAAYLVFNPDPTVVWAKRAARHRSVLEHGRGVDWVLSSSPPESAHVAASLLAKRLGAALIVDMRDGWLDEPLKPLLQKSRVQRWREGWLEARILRQAKHIFVTSTVWRSLLESRLALTRGKTTVLTNGYPLGWDAAAGAGSRRSTGGEIVLLHAGRLSGSSNARTANLLLEPILRGARLGKTQGKVVLLGRLEPGDLAGINYWKPQLEAAGWAIELHAPIPRAEMFKRLTEADGLLLLSASHAAIPSKLFEYLPAGRPILALTPRDSAVWSLCESLPQVFLADYTQQDQAADTVARFLAACSAGGQRFVVPADFSEKALSRVFAEALN